MERVMLAEARSPAYSDYNAGTVLGEMRDMRQVFENRLLAPGAYEARGATNETGIIKAPGQFLGFGNYPTIDPGKAKDINDALHIANDAHDPRHAVYAQHIQNAITAATESIARPVAGYPNATAWVTQNTKSPGPGFYVLGSVGNNTFYGTLPQKPVEKAQHLAKQARAHAAEKHVPKHEKLHRMLMKLSPQLPSIAPIHGRVGQQKITLSPRSGVGDAAGLTGISRPPGAAASLTAGAAAGQGEALSGYRKILADAYAQRAQAKAQRDAARAAMGLPPQGGDLSSRSFAPVGGIGAVERLANRATPGGAVDHGQLAASQPPFHTAADALYPHPQPRSNDTADSALAGQQHSPGSLPPLALEQALNDYFFRQSRLPPNGGAAFNPYLSPLWAGLKIPG